MPVAFRATLRHARPIATLSATLFPGGSGTPVSALYARSRVTKEFCTCLERSPAALPKISAARDALSSDASHRPSSACAAPVYACSFPSVNVGRPPDAASALDSAPEQRETASTGPVVQREGEGRWQDGRVRIDGKRRASKGLNTHDQDVKTGRSAQLLNEAQWKRPRVSRPWSYPH